MNRITQGVRRFVREEDGAAIAEYGLLLAIVAVGLIAILTAFRDDIVLWWDRMKNKIRETPSEPPAPTPPLGG
jgi:Flp pilus assembly pilin Flp